MITSKKNTVYLSTAEAAKVIGVSPIRVRQFAETQRLHPVRAGNMLLYDSAEVAKFAKIPRKWGCPKKK